MTPSLLSVCVASLLLGACTGSAQVHATASVSAPDLVYIGPGVQVIVDYDEPIFYSSHYYWRTEGGAWFRSSSYTTGWVRVDAVPAVILRIEHPDAYVHYHTPAVEAAARASAAAKHDEHNPPTTVRE